MPYHSNKKVRQNYKATYAPCPSVSQCWQDQSCAGLVQVINRSYCEFHISEVCCTGRYQFCSPSLYFLNLTLFLFPFLWYSQNLSIQSINILLGAIPMGFLLGANPVGFLLWKVFYESVSVMGLVWWFKYLNILLRSILMGLVILRVVMMS